jgi:hypothetical protein
MKRFLLLPLLVVPLLWSAIPDLPTSKSHAQTDTLYSVRTGGFAVGGFGPKCPLALPPGPHALDSVIATVRRRYRLDPFGYRITGIVSLSRTLGGCGCSPRNTARRRPSVV